MLEGAHPPPASGRPNVDAVKRARRANFRVFLLFTTLRSAPSWSQVLTKGLQSFLRQRFTLLTKRKLRECF